ncbi:MAG: hypothetical protein JO255_02715 [Alphaproteobacteria bacterium]|nr:hypothetical protein [Alphaproteobacteria bacterium]
MTASPSLITDLESAVELSEQLQIEHFLNGRTDGQALLEALYGATADEPVPERLLALIREARGKR